MTVTPEMEITEMPEYGAMLKCCDMEIADQLDDFFD